MILSVITRTGQVLKVGDNISVAHQTSDRSVIREFIINDNGNIDINVGGNKTHWIEMVAKVPDGKTYREERAEINTIINAESDIYYKLGRQVFGNIRYQDLYYNLKDKITELYKDLKL